MGRVNLAKSGSYRNNVSLNSNHWIGWRIRCLATFTLASICWSSVKIDAVSPIDFIQCVKMRNWATTTRDFQGLLNKMGQVINHTGQWNKFHIKLWSMHHSFPIVFVTIQLRYWQVTCHFFYWLLKRQLLRSDHYFQKIPAMLKLLEKKKQSHGKK